MPEDDVLCPVHGDAALDPNSTAGASLSCQSCARLAASLGELQALARALPVHLPEAIDADVIRARIVAAPPALVAQPSGGRVPSRGARMTRVRWGLGLGLLAGAAVAVVGFIARPRGESGPVSAQRSVPVAGTNTAALNPSEPAHPQARAPVPSVAATAAPAVAVRKNTPAPVSPPARRNDTMAAEHRGARRASADGAPASKNAESPPPPVVGVVETTAPSAAPASNQAATPAPLPTANPPRPEMARDQRAPTGALANGGAQSNPGPAAATSSVRSAIVSAPASAGSPPGPTPAASGSNAPTPTATPAAEAVTDPRARDDRAQDRAQRRQEMRERRHEERIRRVERRR